MVCYVIISRFLVQSSSTISVVAKINSHLMYCKEWNGVSVLFFGDKCLHHKSHITVHATVHLKENRTRLAWEWKLSSFLILPERHISWVEIYFVPAHTLLSLKTEHFSFQGRVATCLVFTWTVQVSACVSGCHFTRFFLIGRKRRSRGRALRGRGRAGASSEKMEKGASLRGRGGTRGGTLVVRLPAIK